MFFRVCYLWLFYGVFLVSCSSSERQIEELREKVWQVELLDSLVLDHLGQVHLQDVSPDGRILLGYDESTKLFLVFDGKGEFISKLDLKGEGPGKYGRYHTGKPVFLDNESFLLMSEKGQFRYDLQGNLLHHYRPDFQVAYRFVVSSSKNSVKVGEGKVVSLLPGRYNDLGFTLEHQVKSRQLEKLDIESGLFAPVVPFPEQSRLSSSSHLFHDVYTRPILASSGDRLFVAFSNESKIYTYKGGLSGEPEGAEDLPFEVFYEAEGIERESGEGGFDLTSFYFGQIRSLDYFEKGHFLIGYTEGLPLDEVKSLHEEYKHDLGTFFTEIGKANKAHLKVWNGEFLSNDLALPEYFGLLAKVLGKEDIWFDVDFSKRENDYTVFYKVRLVIK